MVTNQGERQRAFRDISGTTGDYNGDSIAAFQAQGVTETEYNGAFIAWLQARTGSSKDNLNDLQAQFAADNGFSQWNDVDEISNTINVQNFSITITATNASNTATIEAVDTDRTVLITSGYTIDGNAANRDVYAGLTLTDSTTITATRDRDWETSVCCCYCD